jgi:hypothetical protein
MPCTCHVVRFAKYRQRHSHVFGATPPSSTAHMLVSAPCRIHSSLQSLLHQKFPPKASVSLRTSLFASRSSWNDLCTSSHHRTLATHTSLPQAKLSRTGPKNGRAHLPPSDAQRSTIYALSTPQGKGGVAVIRVSGPDALRVWQKMIVRTAYRHGHKDTYPTPWIMQRCCVIDAETQEALDDGLAVFFKGTPVL